MSFASLHSQFQISVLCKLDYSTRHFLAVGVDLAGLTLHAEALKVRTRVDSELGMFNVVA